MKNELTEEDIKKIAAQVRKPEGEHGIEIGELMNDGNGPMNLHTIAVLNPQQNEIILEIGMGNGHFVKNIVSLDSSIKYIGCDYSELMVKEASQKNNEFVSQGNASFIHADAQELPFKNHTFDKVFTINTLYFWDEHVKVIKELKRVLKKGGIVVLTIRPKHNLEMFPISRYGFSIFTKEEIIELMNSNGFNFKEATEIKEPDQERWGGMVERETLILTFKS